MHLWPEPWAQSWPPGRMGTVYREFTNADKELEITWVATWGESWANELWCIKSMELFCNYVPKCVWFCLVKRERQAVDVCVDSPKPKGCLCKYILWAGEAEGYPLPPLRRGKEVKVLVPQSCPMDSLWPQAPLSMGFSRQEKWSGVPFPSPGDLSNPGIKLRSPALQADSLPSESPGKPINNYKTRQKFVK